MLLKQFTQIINDKVNTNELNSSNYISTENMLANFGGVCKSAGVPIGKCTEFHTKDVLISNIRPYFKKFWFANFNGGCSNDVFQINLLIYMLLVVKELKCQEVIKMSY